MAEPGTIANIYNKKSAAICSLLALVVGFAGLLGWLTDNHFLKTFLSDGATMKVNTALLVLFSGVSLFLQTDNKRRVGRIIALIVILLSGAILVEYVFGANLHIDELFIKDHDTNPLREAPGRTSLITACCALLTGIGLWVMSKRHFWFAQLLGTIVFTVVYISLIGHIFKITGFYQFGIYSGVAFHTALGLLAVATGLLLAERQKGWLGFLSGRLKNRSSRVYFVVYVLGAAPLMAAIYLFVIRHSGLTAASDVVILILVTLILTMPVAYFLLKTVGNLGKELQDSDVRLQIALDAAQLGVWHIDPQTRGLVYNPILARIFGYEGNTPMTYDQAIGQVTEAYRDQIINEINAAIKTGENYDIIYQQKRFNDGALIWLRSFGKVTADIDGRVSVFSGVVMDITENIRQQEQLQQLNEELAATIEEVRATNEELVSSSDARQKLLEEFEALNEELRLANEDQVSVNQQLGNLNEKYRQAQDELSLAINAAALATFDYNPVTGRFAGNDLLKAWFGLSLDDEIELKTATDKVVEADRAKVIQAIGEALDYSSGGRFDVEYAINSRASIEPKIVRAKGRAVFNERNEPIRLSGIIQDITEQKKDDQRKNDFIGMVSHELKTPLTSLSALIQVLNVKFKNSEDQFVPGALRKATAQVKKMGSMINGFLNVSRLESGKILIEKSNFNIDQLGREVIEDIRLTVTDHQFQLTACSPINLYADREKISSVLNNLLTNAVKYSPKNSEIILNCEVHPGQVIISVHDQGSGISEVDQQRVFERYFRVSSGQSFTISGFGIGLYLSAEIVERHGGKIWVDSQPGEGSTFYFSLPLND